MMLRVFSSAVVLLVLNFQSAVSAGPPSHANAETLENGNQRGAKPSAQELAGVVAKSRKNMIVLPGGAFEMGDWGRRSIPAACRSTTGCGGRHGRSRLLPTESGWLP